MNMFTLVVTLPRKIQSITNEPAIAPIITATLGGSGHTFREFPVGYVADITLGMNVRSFVFEARARYINLVL